MQTKRKSATGGTIPTAAATPAQPKPELTKAQQLVCDEVAELLFQGGREEDLNALLSAALGSALWRSTSRTKCFSEADIEDAVLRDLAEYRLDIIAGWRRNERAPETPKLDSARAVAERIGARVLNELREYFTRFAEDASPTDRRLLHDVLFDWDMVSHGGTSLGGTVDLGEAFARQLGAETTYLEVPARHMEDVAQYARLLQKTDRTAA